MLDKTTSFDAHLQHLQDIMFVRDVKVLPAPLPPADAVLRVVTINGRTHKLYVEEKKAPFSKTTLSHIVARFAGKEASYVLFAGFVPAALATEMAERNINFIDRNGNCFLRLGDSYVAHVQGRTAVRMVGEKRLHGASVRVVLALAVDESLLQAPTRTISAQAGGVSPQTVSDVIEFLRHRNIVDGHRHRKWLGDAARRLSELLVHLWPSCATSLTVQRYRSRARHADDIEATLTPQLAALGEWRWSGGLAVGKLTKEFTSDDAWIYVAKRPVMLPRFEGLLPDPQGNVRLLTSPGPAAFANTQMGGQIRTVHPLLVYLDAIATGDARTNEAARDLLRLLEESA
jgi:hypothetical protein